MENSHIYVKMELVENQKRLALLNLDAHQDTDFVLMKLVNN
jgi:hypothetical protein